MKMMKKALIAASVMAVLSFGFMGCGNEDDDPEGAISGSGNNYSVFYDNAKGYYPETDTGADTENTASKNGSGVYRAWKRTTLKHWAALVKITLDKVEKSDGTVVKAGQDSGVMGFVWDLQTNKGSVVETDGDSETFLIAGVRNSNGTLQYYVSKYFNISNKQALNFGVGTNSKTNLAQVTGTDAETNTPGEWVIADIQTLDSTTVTTETKDVWIDVFPKYNGNDKYGKYRQDISGDTAYSGAANGSYIVDFYLQEPDGTVAPTKRVVVPGGENGTGYDDKPDQKKLAVYTNIYAKHALSGTWKYSETYKEAALLEEADLIEDAD